MPIFYLYNIYNMTKLIFITGGSASGKTSLALHLRDTIKNKVTLISQDMFYKPTRSDDTNYDLPSAFDWELQRQVFNDLKNGKDVKIPVYDFATHDRVGETHVKAGDVVLFEGLFTFHDLDMLKNADLKIYVDTPSDTRLARRITRDINERGRKLENVIERWQRDVQPSFNKYISINKYEADLIIPWQKVSSKGVNSIVSTIHSW